MVLVFTKYNFWVPLPVGQQNICIVNLPIGFILSLNETENRLYEEVILLIWILAVFQELTETFSSPENFPLVSFFKMVHVGSIDVASEI